MPEIACARHAALFCALLLCVPYANAQTRKGPAPQAPQNVVRAIAVYEWTGDLAKPTAARVLPVSLYLDNHFEDAALYLSRPMPLALETGTIYELESAGVNKGTLTLTTATHLHNADAATTFDDGWFGYGTWKPLQPPKTVAINTAPSNVHVITSGEGQPHFTKMPDTPAPDASTTASTAPPAPSASKPSDAPPVDPNRPILHHTAPGDAQNSGTQPADTQTTSTTPTTTSPAPTTSAPPSSPTPSADPDRPTLHRSAPQNKKQQPANSDASVTTAGGLLADDPNRPRLHHGGTTAAATLPALKGLPADMHQMAAVSDAASRPEHNFAYEWTDANQKSAILAKLETMARAELAPTPVKPTRTVARTHKATALPPVALLDEELHAYEISYGGVDVFIFTAHTAGEGAALQYVTLIAQPDIYGALHLLLHSVTNATNMDQTPRMRFIDAVDADGDNRAELLFELRGETQRQFALYRITPNAATQAFLTGTTQ